eukprot:6187378-Pleurochrysis_carterae.AAC.5
MTRQEGSDRRRRKDRASSDDRVSASEQTRASSVWAPQGTATRSLRLKRIPAWKSAHSVGMRIGKSQQASKQACKVELNTEESRKGLHHTHASERRGATSAVATAHE